MTITPGRRGSVLHLANHDRDVIEGWSKSRTAAARVVLRSRIILMLAKGSGATEVAMSLATTLATVRLWRRRFEQFGPRGLLNDAKGRGRKPAIDPAAWEVIAHISNGNETKSLREMSRALGVSASTVSRWLRKAQVRRDS